MKMNYWFRIAVTFLGIGLLFVAGNKNAFAHCDTLDGPVVQTARIALEKGDITSLLKWVRIPFEVATQFRCNPPPNSGGSRHLIPHHLATP